MGKLTNLPPVKGEWKEEKWRFYVFPLTGIYFALYAFTKEWYSMIHLEAGLPAFIILEVFFIWQLSGDKLATLMKEREVADDKAPKKETEMANDNNVKEPLVN